MRKRSIYRKQINKIMESRYYCPKIKQRIIWSLFFVVISVSWMLSIYSAEIKKGIFSGWLTSTAILVSLSLLMINASYFVLTETSILQVRMFIFCRRVNLSNISQIKKGIIGGIFRSPTIFIEYKGKVVNSASLNMDIELYGRQTVIQFLRSIHALNPDIPMDAPSRKLMEENPDQKEPSSSELFEKGKKELFKNMFPGRESKDN